MPEKYSKFGTFMAVTVVIAVLAVAGYIIYTNPKGPFGSAPILRGESGQTLAFAERIAKLTAGLQWEKRAEDRKLTRPMLQKSLDLGKSFMLANQKPEGNFQYEYDFVEKELTKDDNQVRQAGALWGISLINRNKPDPVLTEALNRGLDFFFRISRDDKSGGKYLVYPRERACSTGAVALVALSIIEYLRVPDAMPADRRVRLEAFLDGYLKFLRSQQLNDGRFAMDYNYRRGMRTDRTSPYFDGETLLALCKAARYLGRADYLPVIQKAARRMAEVYTVEAWATDRDSDQTKGFYQWGSMSFREYAEAGWKDSEIYENTALALAWWMIHTHNTLSSTRNSAYAHEGLVSAYMIAKKRGDAAAMNDIAYVNDRGLYKLTGWQVGGPLAAGNSFLKSHPTSDKQALGGIMNKKNDAPLRIDVTQHQMHAVILSLDNLYTE